MSCSKDFYIQRGIPAVLFIIGAALYFFFPFDKQVEQGDAQGGKSPFEPSQMEQAHSSDARPHGDHRPQHGGLVLMDGDLHFEVVIDPRAGSIKVFFSDEVRRPLPASIVSELKISLIGEQAEGDFIKIIPDATDSYWMAQVEPITNLKALVRVEYIHQDQPYEIDIPAHH